MRGKYLRGTEVSDKNAVRVWREVEKDVISFVHKLLLARAVWLHSLLKLQLLEKFQS